MNYETRMGKGGKEFDHTRFARRHVALLLSYLGWDYDGLVVQEDTENTVMGHLYKALDRTKLIETRELAKTSVCGRTDKGVSSAHQVVGIHLRSNLREGQGVYIPEGHSQDPSQSKAEEVNYANVLNRVLPLGIRVVAWAPVDENFSARFACTRRVYKYWFPLGSLSLERMRAAAAHLLGLHDFRLFSKQERNPPPGKTSERTIYAVTIQPNGGEEEGGFGMVEVTVEGSGFLWHMIRCIVAVLLRVGEGDEDPDVVRQMLLPHQLKGKPQYALASELPLCLFTSEYQGTDLHWHWDQNVLESYVEDLQRQWAQTQIKATMIRSMLDRLPSLGVSTNVRRQHALLYPGPRPKTPKPLIPPSLLARPNSPPPKRPRQIDS